MRALENKFSDKLNAKMNVLVFGSGAREHAIADSISKSPILGKLYLAQSGCFHLGEVIKFTSYENLAKKCVDLDVNLVIIGPEDPICKGIADVFKGHNISCIAVDEQFSQLESSKVFAKKFMEKYGIKTAKYSVISYDLEYSRNIHNPEIIPHAPFVIKANGLCKGKGVVIAEDEQIAQKTIDEFLRGKFGDSSKTILVEEFLQGEEMSLMSLYDGKNLLHFAPTRDFKRLSGASGAPNTGGMGAFCPVVLSDDQRQKLEAYKAQLQNALVCEGADFVGFIYSGLIWAQTDKVSDWHVLEYNVRLGDPETQAILTHLKTDFLSVLKAAATQELNKITLEYEQNTSACLVVACEGYPTRPKDGKKITLPEKNEKIKIFNAGVKEVRGELYSSGGRVLSLCTTSKKPFKELKEFARQIKMDNKYFREDIEV